MSARICIVTAGHLATCPRMLKAADALAAAGYRVRVVCSRYLPWATAADADLLSRRSWRPHVVAYDRETNRRAYLITGARFRAARRLTSALGAARSPLPLAARAYSRVHPELVRAILAEPADLIYGGTNGALAAVSVAAHRARMPYALDLEDFHSAEQGDGPGSTLVHDLAGRIESATLPSATFLTGGSAGIAAAYAERYGVHPIPINNTFPLPAQPPELTPSAGASLRLYWFSQTIGPGRGLEDAVLAMGLAAVAGELHLRGQPVPGYLDDLRRLARDRAPQLALVHHEPAPPDTMVELCKGYDIGLSLEQDQVRSRALCLTNKVFTYLLAGLAVALSDTPGQRPLAMELGCGAALYKPGDTQVLAAAFKRWATQRDLLAQAKSASWDAARRRWHWEHPEERGALLRAVEEALR